MGITADEDYDAYYTVSYSAKDTYIQWNRETKAGRIRDESLFGDDSWHCWDSALMNTDCL
jgi:hypothetical protein